MRNRNINRRQQPPTGGETRGGPSGEDKPVYGCTDPNALNFNPLANINNGSCVYEDPVDWDGAWGPAQSNQQYFIFLCANRNDCLAGCLNGPNEDFSNHCSVESFGLLWYNGDEPDYPYESGEGCCVNDSPPIYSDYWTQNNDMNFPTIQNAFGGNISWESYDSIFVMNCGPNSDECPEDIFSPEFYSRMCTHLWIPETGYQDIESAMTNPGGENIFVDGQIYNAAAGFMANVNMVMTGQVGEEWSYNLCAPGNPVHIFVYKRSRGQVFRTDNPSSLIIPKGLDTQYNWLDWPEEYVYYLNNITFTKILPLGYYQTVGCMDPTAYNYNPMANLQEPDSCNYAWPKWGCMNENCENYNLDANADDGSCTGCFQECRWPCREHQDCRQYEPHGLHDTGPMVCLPQFNYVTGLWLWEKCCMERSPGPDPTPTPQGRLGGQQSQTKLTRQSNEREILIDRILRKSNGKKK